MNLHQETALRGMTITELPSELFCYTSSFLSPQDVQTLINFELTCFTIHKSFQNTPIWQQQYYSLTGEENIDSLSSKRIVVQLGEHMDKMFINDAANLNVDNVIQCILQGTKQLTQNEIRGLIFRSNILFMKEPMLLELQSPIHIVGDIHGHYKDLIHIFNTNGYPSNVTKYLLLGDYVDRGKESIQVICLLLAYKIKYPNSIYLLRGKHECNGINRIYGFYDDVKTMYCVNLWKYFEVAFKVMPTAAVVSDTFFCLHGGPSKDLQMIQQIKELVRPIDIQDSELLAELLWMNYDTSIDYWHDDVDNIYGLKAVEKILDRLNLKTMIVAQLSDDGYTDLNRLITIFSASNYCEDFSNFGAIITINDMNVVKFSKYRV
jgi:serine/threonine-protein phosphatase PP1 catalytic subunit